LGRACAPLCNQPAAGGRGPGPAGTDWYDVRSGGYLPRSRRSGCHLRRRIIGRDVKPLAQRSNRFGFLSAPKKSLILACTRNAGGQAPVVADRKAPASASNLARKRGRGPDAKSESGPLRGIISDLVPQVRFELTRRRRRPSRRCVYQSHLGQAWSGLVANRSARRRRLLPVRLWAVARRRPALVSRGPDRRSPVAGAGAGLPGRQSRDCRRPCSRASWAAMLRRSRAMHPIGVEER